MHLVRLKQHKFIFLFIFLSFFTNQRVSAQTDIGMPKNSPFNIEGDITGSITQSVNEISGKVTFSVPLGSIKSGNLSHQLGLLYNGQDAFKTAQEQNKYSPTSIIGVGWSLQNSKIFVDNKQTAVQDDDDFYLFDGSTTSKLFCIKRDENVWKFQLEKYANWIIEYYMGGNSGGFNPYTGQFTYVKYDYWKIVKEDGNSYYFGYTDNSGIGVDWNTRFSDSKSKEQIVAWGNWIGDSKATGGENHTIVWNLSRMRDQWGNFIDYDYELEEQSQSGSIKHTEASYLKSIKSSKGSRIEFTYGDKSPGEYYEPHREMNEPDAYQERYEKKFLSKIDFYNYSDKKITTYNLSQSVYGSNFASTSTKRYLMGIQKTNHKATVSENLPSQTFEYDISLSSDFNGALKKITYPSGGSITYNYSKKNIFYNGANRFDNITTAPSNFTDYSRYVSDEYTLWATASENPVSGNYYNFRFYRFWWNGEKWKNNEFILPQAVETENNNYQLKRFQIVTGENFYGFAHQLGTSTKVYLFAKKADGTWHTKTFIESIGSGKPSFLNGNDFVALGANENGKLYTYHWRGNNWTRKVFSQGSGKYHYRANNNFIISLQRSNQDVYRFFYLDASKNWELKTWSSLSPIQNIGSASYLYPSNTMTGFMADNQNEYFLRWNTKYDLAYVDDVLGHYNDSNPMIPIGNGYFSVVDNFSNSLIKAARFNGQTWITGQLPSSSLYYPKINFGRDIMTFQNHDNISGIGYYLYNPNLEQFSYGSLNNNYNAGHNPRNGVTRDFIIAGDKVYRKDNSTNNNFFDNIGYIAYGNEYTYTNGYRHAYVKHIDGNTYDASLYYINKYNGQLNTIPLNNRHFLFTREFAGSHTKFLSLNSIWLRSEGYNNSFSTYLYRLIDDKIKNQVYDNVVESIEVDDLNNTRIIEYSYDQPRPTPNNEIINYGKVTLKNKGFGAGNQGKIVKEFKTGIEDLQETGLLKRILIYDNQNNLVKKSTFGWIKPTKSAINESSSNIVGISYSNLLQYKEDNLYHDSGIISNHTYNYYNNFFQLNKQETNNSKGQSVTKEITYAHENYNFVREKNMFHSIYETKTFLDNTLKSKQRNVFVNENINFYDRVYLKEKWSGDPVLELDQEITSISGDGNIQEVNDGNSNFNCVIKGYTNKFEVAQINNAQFSEVINELDVSYNELQNLQTADLKLELKKLYDRIPEAIIKLKFYDDYGRLKCKIDPRQEETYFHYDIHDRIKYVTDSEGNILEYRHYNYSNEN